MCLLGLPVSPTEQDKDLVYFAQDFSLELGPNIGQEDENCSKVFVELYSIKDNHSV